MVRIKENGNNKIIGILDALCDFLHKFGWLIWQRENNWEQKVIHIVLGWDEIGHESREGAGFRGRGQFGAFPGRCCCIHFTQSQLSVHIYLFCLALLCPMPLSPAGAYDCPHRSHQHLLYEFLPPFSFTCSILSSFPFFTSPTFLSLASLCTLKTMSSFYGKN